MVRRARQLDAGDAQSSISAKAAAKHLSGRMESGMVSTLRLRLSRYRAAL